ncbi:MAG: ubiquitin-like domain-containing protein [Mycobacteriales bacterium]
MSRSTLPPAPSSSQSVARRLPVLLGVLLTALLAGGVAWTGTGKTATLSIDGQPDEVGFRGETVADVLAAAGLSVGEHDLLVPSASTAVEDGAKVALRRGRQLELVVDGQPRMVWVTAASVDEALDQVGLRKQNLALSASRTRDLPLEGFRLQVSTAKRIAVIADNATQERDTTAATVGEALAEFGVGMDADDRLSQPATDPITGGLIIRVTRVGSERIEEQVAVPFGTEQRPDADLFSGETKELAAGKDGLLRRSVERVYGDGVLERSTVLFSTPVVAPVNRVVAVGTKTRPAPAPAPPALAPRTAPVRTALTEPAEPLGGTGAADSLNWAALAQCESGGNPRAVNPSGAYRGLYQFSIATWRGVGGAGDPIDNSAGEQTYRAKLLYLRGGAGQWPQCGRRLFG